MKLMKDQTCTDFPVGTHVGISFSDNGMVIGTCTVLEYGELLAVMLLDTREGATSPTGMQYKLVLVHPTNITSSLRQDRPYLSEGNDR